MNKLLRFAVILTALITSSLLAKDGPDPKAAFKRGADLMEKCRFKEAIPFLKKVEKAFPDDASVLWNLGLASAEVHNNPEALVYWQKIQKAEPDNWRAISKLIQTYQALGNFKARDDEIHFLYERRASSKDAELSKADRFCREQFAVAGKKIFAFEIFEPQAERRMFYRFAIVNAAGYEVSYISLGSYDFTNDIARELGEISNGERLYHVDRYVGNGHETYAFFKTQPSYDEVRGVVVNIMQGKAKLISASRPTKSGLSKEKPK